MFTKVDELMWKDSKFKDISTESKLLFIYLLSSQHRNVLGLYNLPKYYVTGDLGYPIETVTKGLNELSNKGFIKYDEKSEVVFVKNFLKYNSLDNPNQVKGAVKVLPTIPKTQLFYNLIDRLESNNLNQSENLMKAVNQYLKDNGFKRVDKGLDKGLPKQEEEEVEEKEEVKEEENNPAKAGEIADFKKTKVPYNDIVDLYNQKLGDVIPSVRSINQKRKRKMKVRWNNELDNLEKWEEVFDAVKEQSFCLGDNSNGWNVTFDWLIKNDNNFVKVLERQYQTKKDKSHEDKMKDEWGEWING